MRKFQFPISKGQIIISALLILFVFLMMDLNARLTELSRQNDQLRQIQGDVLNYRKTETFLKTQIAFAKSDAGVEAWARQENSESQSGDILIVPLPGNGPTPTPHVTPTATPEPIENWVVWRTLFFGD
jgi:cell division protein FtsB